jgi:hypothetical protein
MHRRCRCIADVDPYLVSSFHRFIVSSFHRFIASSPHRFIASSLHRFIVSISDSEYTAKYTMGEESP